MKECFLLSIHHFGYGRSRFGHLQVAMLEDAAFIRERYPMEGCRLGAITSDSRLCSCERRRAKFRNELLVATTTTTRDAPNTPYTKALRAGHGVNSRTHR